MLLVCVLGIIELNCLLRFGDIKKNNNNNINNENENLFLRAFVVHKIAKQIISRRREDENTCKKLWTNFLAQGKTSAFNDMTQHAVSMAT